MNKITEAILKKVERVATLVLNPYDGNMRTPPTTDYSVSQQ